MDMVVPKPFLIDQTIPPGRQRCWETYGALDINPAQLMAVLTIPVLAILVMASCRKFTGLPVVCQ